MSDDLKARSLLCTVELHHHFGGACYHCCQDCNYNDHRCQGCGVDLRHDYTEWPPPHSQHYCDYEKGE